MATFVLVHGAFHGAWCWERLTPLLESEGHAVIARDLPGAGDDSTPWREVTLEGYGRAVTALMDEVDERVVLVGHSMGGIAISRAAELRPEKVRYLVYLAADLLRAGESVMDVFAREENADSLALANFVSLEDGGLATTTEEGWRPAYFTDVSDDDMAWIRPRLRPQAVAPLTEPMVTTPERWGSVPRAFIETAGDRALNLATQRLMQAGSPCDPVITLQTSHSPFVSAPGQLAQALLRFA